MPNPAEAVLPESTLWERIHVALQTIPYFDEEQVQFATRRGEVTLHGSVASFFHKQMAQEALRDLDGIDEIYNELEVMAAG